MGAGYFRHPWEQIKLALGQELVHFLWSLASAFNASTIVYAWYVEWSRYLYGIIRTTGVLTPPGLAGHRSLMDAAP